MKVPMIRAALALLLLSPAAPAMADDPHDPAMRSKAARARDHANIQRLNRAELARVRARDARWSRENARRRERYAAAMDRYRADMARWRRAVAACRAGDRRYCER